MGVTSFFHGVTVSYVDSGPRTIAVPSSSIVGLVDTYLPGADLAAPNVPVQLTSYREAVAAFGERSPLTQAARAIYAQSKAVVIATGISTEVGDFSDVVSAVIGGETASGARTGLQTMLDAKSKYNVQPRLLIAPGASTAQAVATAMDSLASKLRAIAIVDGPNTDDEAAIGYAANFGSKRIYMVDPGVTCWNTNANADVGAWASAYVAGLFCQTDANVGFWASPSNKELVDITGTKRPIEFLHGDETCRANLLNNARIATIIRDGGYRLWGNRTLSADPKWAFVTRVRTLDIVMDAVLAGHKWAVDRGITATYVDDVTKGLQAFMRDLKRQGALINFEVYADPELNTASQLEQGKVYWNIRFTDVPPAENPIFRFEITNQWLTEVLDIHS
ncbi:MAG: phage tail sheath family protein [Pararobbsia sp.]